MKFASDTKVSASGWDEADIRLVCTVCNTHFYTSEVAITLTELIDKALEHKMKCHKGT